MPPLAAFKVSTERLSIVSCAGQFYILLETILIIDAVPDLPGFWASVASEALRVQQQVHILGVWRLFVCTGKKKVSVLVAFVKAYIEISALH